MSPSQARRVRLAVGAFALCAAASLATAANPGSPLRKAMHEPPAPRSGETVLISVAAADPLAQVQLWYQLVDPGAYVEAKEPAFRTRWTSQEMNPGRKRNGTTVFTFPMPPDLQQNRRLVRYRFTARDPSGLELSLPATNDVVPNFAYFVYDGIPAWTGAINPNSGDDRLRSPLVFDPNAMRRVQSYLLLAKGRSITNITWKERAPDKAYRYTGTLVADGVVYDHIRLRARGGYFRYSMVKNMWKLAFPKGHELRALDDYGNAHPVRWSKLNLRACIQQNDGCRGEAGLFEAVGFRLFNLAGVPASLTHWIQLRVITTPEETPASQYQGDFWGLYLAIEDLDGRFLRTHGLEDGNLFKIQWGGPGTLSHAAEGAVTNLSDLHQFMAAYQTTTLSESRWRSLLDLPEYYSYRALCDCIHHYDIGDNKNYYYYRNPESGRWRVIPFDLDLTWSDHMYGNGEEPLKRPVLTRPKFRLEFQNRLREIRDLLYNPVETGRLIDECAAVIADPAGGPSPVDADRAKWDYHPLMRTEVKAGQGLFYRTSRTRDFAGMAQLMKDYVATRGKWIDTRLLNDALIPATPEVAYTGPPGFPASALSFRVSEYRGGSPFAAAQYRLAEIAPPVLARGCPIVPGKYEITPAWTSGDLTHAVTEFVVPAKAVAAGLTYRVRARVQDTAGAWSHWSAPVEFVAGTQQP